MSDSSLNAFDIGEFAKGNVPTPVFLQLLFQTGYLTIDKKLDFGMMLMYKLRFPNFEVQNSFENILFEVYSGMRYEIALSYVANIFEAAYENRIERMIELFKNFFAEIPYASCATSAQLDNFQLRKRREATYTIQIPEEKYYQTIVFCIFKMCGMEIEAENATNKGRIDAVLDTPQTIYIFEFKINQNADEALEQIMKKEYFQKFIESAKAAGKKICCMGMNFSTKERNVTDCRYDFA